MEKKISDLQVGDKVILHCRYYDKVSVVSRLTNTLIIVEGTKYRKENGLAYERHNYTSIDIATQDKIDAINAKKLRNDLIYKIQKFNFHSLSMDKLQQIDKIISE